jgi:hypothetical protein
MKKSNLLKTVTKRAFSAFLFVICAFSVISVLVPGSAEAITALVGMGSSGGYAVAAVGTLVSGADTRATATAARPRSETDPGHLIDEVSRVVTKIRPDEFPMDSILRKMNNSEEAKDFEVFFEEVEYRGRKDTVTTALAAPTGTTQADKYRDIEVGNPALFVEGEAIIIQSISGASTVDGSPLRLRIDRKNDDGTLKVHALNTVNNVVPAIPDDTVILRGATSYGELKAQAGVSTNYPGVRSNYCQRFMAQVEQGKIRSKIASKSGYGMKEQNFMRMYDMRTEMEESSIFGVKSKTFSLKDNEDVYTQQGVFHEDIGQLEYTTASGIDNNRWIDWTKDIFSDNSGSKDRILFGGRNMIAEILKIDMVQKQLDAKAVEIVPGLKIKSVETSFGNLLIYHHKLFDQLDYLDDGLVLDMTNIKRRPFQALKKEALELAKSGQKYVDAYLISEISCIETRYLGTHFRIKKTA